MASDNSDGLNARENSCQDLTTDQRIALDAMKVRNIGCVFAEGDFVWPVDIREDPQKAKAVLSVLKEDARDLARIRQAIHEYTAPMPMAIIALEDKTQPEPAIEKVKTTTRVCQGDGICVYARASESEFCPCTITTRISTQFWNLGGECLYDSERKVNWRIVELKAWPGESRRGLARHGMARRGKDANDAGNLGGCPPDPEDQFQEVQERRRGRQERSYEDARIWERTG